MEMMTREPLRKGSYECFEAFASSRGDAPFLFNENRVYTAAEAFTTARAFAGALYRNGVREGDYVALRCTRSVDTVLLYFALQFLGTAAVLCDPHMGIVEFLKSTGVALTPKFAVTNERAAGGVSADGNWELFSNGSFVPLKADGGEFPVTKDIDKPAAVIFTSGSTSKSKAVVISQYGIVNNGYNHVYSMNWQPTETAIAALPLHHAFGIACMGTALMSQCALFIPVSTKPEYLYDSMKKFKVTHIECVPSLCYALAKVAEARGETLPALRTGMLGAAPITEEQFLYIEKQLGAKFVIGYGMSEYIGMTLGKYEDDAKTRANAVGTFPPLSCGCILNAQGEELKANEEGEICVKGPTLMLGYYGDEAATKAVIDKKGWLHTGDLGYVDERGYVHVSGRMKDVIIRNGVNISAAKIERAILSLPEVESTAVVRLSHEKCGEVPGAFVVLKKGAALSGEELKERIKPMLYKNESPEYVLFAPAMLLTHSGKPDKQRIKELF